MDNNDFIIVFGTQNKKPDELEIAKNTVFIRKNIELIEETLENGDRISLWKYLERKVPLRDYIMEAIKQGK